ncbi:efflux RND transporter permease subunit [Brachybacterium sp. NBEC-018]|uniref:efflux RND transporter permease subunit n=1 Tax=Brachybacterium sp. NBEC-018 TaxID=2996004 RepID=UPI002174FEA7|nr:efflux RND transporter permease subunit [Brachybacterium sp. NBEC-018]UVY84866.1 efflux RND transporter permease subunit [Brachybacterium sp. NBEC-018]
MHRLAHLSLNNRAFIALVCIAVSIIGVFSMSTMRQELIPSVSLPQIQIVTTSQGSTSEQIEERISSPIEQAVSGIENVESTSSTSQANTSMVTLELTYGTDVSRSANQVDAALTRIEDQLPDGTDPQVIAGGSGDIPAVVLSVSSDLDPSELADRLDSQVVKELERVDGVSSVAVIGAPEEIVRITPDEDELTAKGLTDNDIKTALDDNGLSAPGGTVTDSDRSLDVVLGKSMSSLKDLESMVLMPAESSDATAQTLGQTPEVTTLGDVAKVERTTQDATSISRTDGRESLVLMVTATADGNVVDVSQDVEDTMADLLPGVGGSAKSDVVFDQAPFIQESIVALAEEGALGLLMAIGVILLFLRRVRPTVVTAISIPTSLLIAFIGMLVSGYTLNMLTLAALTISIGRVVDDSIVVIENITRHLSYGKPRRRAILDGVREVAGAVTASTLATVVVYLPIALVAGMAGELFRPFALTVAIAMLSSLLVSLTIVPVLAYWFLRAPKAAAAITDPDDPSQQAKVREDAEAKEEKGWLHRLYAPILHLTLDSLPRRLGTVAVAILVLIGSGFLIPLMTVNFLGDTGQNIASITQTLPAGTSLEQSSDKATDAEKALMDVDGVETVQTTIGGGGAQAGLGGGAGGENTISYSITTATDVEDQQALTEKLVDTLKDLPDAGEVESSDVGSATGSSTVDIEITGPTAEDRKSANDAILAELDPLPSGVTDVTSDLEGDEPTAVVTVDRTAAAEKGLTENAVIGMVAAQLYPGSIGTIALDDSDLDIYVEQGEKVDTLTQLKDLELAPGLPLTDVAEVSEQNSRPSISTKDGVETVTIALTPAGDDVGTVSEAANAAIDAADLPEGTEATLGGTSADINETFGQLGLAMAAAILLVYVLLVWIFKSLIQPLVLLVSIPFAAVGAFGLLVITGVPLGLPSMIGLLMLVGIVVTNAIVLIDLVNQYRRDGMALDEALHLGASKRLRPILMTAAATIFALIPMGLGLTGNGGFIAQPLAVVVIGGLVSSTLLTLVIVPVLYRMVEGPGERRRLRREAQETEQRAQRDAADAERRERHRSESATTGEDVAAAPTAPAPASSGTASTGTTSTGTTGTASTGTAAAGNGSTGSAAAGSAPAAGAAHGRRAATPATGTPAVGRPSSPASGAERGRRASLKERGGIVGILRRRFRR